jgi:hypothetical protein
MITMSQNTNFSSTDDVKTDAMKRTPFQGEKQIKLQVYRDVNPVLYWKFNKALREQLGTNQLLVIFQ